jgi:monovalent cation:H+ antiporter-2, CPA2 family
MPEHSFEPYRDLLLFLATAAVIVPLFARFKLSPVLGFLLAGVMLGPFGLGALARDIPWLYNVSITDSERIAPFAEFGVAFLLFMIGLELSWGRLMSMKRLVFGFGSLQVVVTSVVLAGVAFLLGQTLASAIILGSALALSSTALILPALSGRKRLGTPSGRGAFAVLLFQDLAVAPLLLLVSILGARDLEIGSGLLYALGPGVVAIALMLVLGRLVLRPLFHLVASTKSSEHFVALCLFIVIGAAVLSAAAGQSMALGAFVAGLLLAETEYRRVVEVTIQPFQGLLLGLLFVSIGAGLDLSHLLVDPLPTLGVVAGVMILKFAVIVPAARAFGLSFPVAREIGLVLAPAGEFALVLIGAAVAQEIVPASSGAIAIVAATVSMFTIPSLVTLSERLAGKRAKGDDDQLSDFVPDVHDGPARVILVGYGRVGELVGQMLDKHQIEFLALDTDPGVVRRARKAGRKVYFGDASNPELLRRCGIAKAPALVVTSNDPHAVEAVVQIAREERPDLVIVARARDTKQAAKLYSLQATDAVPENLEASLQLAEAVLVDIGVPMGPVIASIHEKRDEFRKELRARLRSSPSRRAT